MDRTCQVSCIEKEDFIQGGDESGESDLQTKRKESTSKGEESTSKEGKDGRKGNVKKFVYTPEFYQKNKERIDRNNARWKEKNKEKVKQYLKQWRFENPDKLKKHNEDRKRRLKIKKEEERIHQERQEKIRKEEEKRLRKAKKLGLQEL